MKKSKQRSIMLEKRSKHSVKKQQIKSAQISKLLAQSSLYTEADTVAFYHAVRGEADPYSLKQRTDKSFFLPILSDLNDEGLRFASFDESTQLKNNKFLIPEPICDLSDCYPARDLDIVLMPLLGFDLTGSRLGMGGGYYDRCFAFKQRNSHSLKPILIGYAFDFQEITHIPTEPWDIKLNAVVTESRFIEF